MDWMLARPAKMIAAACLAPLAIGMVACDPQTYDTTPPSRFLLTCTRPDTATMVLQLDTGTRRFTLVSADGAPEGSLARTPTTYRLVTAGWSGVVNRYDGRLALSRRSKPQAPAPGPEAWSCASAVDRAKF